MAECHCARRRSVGHVAECRVTNATRLLRPQARADLFLDTPLYNGHVTAGDALWAGVPMVQRGRERGRARERERESERARARERERERAREQERQRDRERR